MPKQTTKLAWNSQTRRPQRRRQRLETHNVERHLDPRNRRSRSRHTDMTNTVKHGQKTQVNKPGQTKPQVTASQTQPWGVTPRPATTGDAHANYHFSPRQLLARGSQSSLGLRWCRERWCVVFVFEVAGWRALFSSSLIRTLFGAGSEPPGAGPLVGWRYFLVWGVV